MNLVRMLIIGFSRKFKGNNFNKFGTIYWVEYYILPKNAKASLINPL